jgi:hypothetical protein
MDNNQQLRPWFGVFLLARGVTVVCFGKLFQAKLQKDELFSQRNDKTRIRVFGLSFKLFG